MSFVGKRTKDNEFKREKYDENLKDVIKDKLLEAIQKNNLTWEIVIYLLIPSYS
jgi:hypothetical protein